MSDQVRVDSGAGHPTSRVAEDAAPAEPTVAGRPSLPCGDDDAALCRERTSSSLARMRLLLPVLALLHLGTAVAFTAVRVPQATADPAMLEAWRDGLRWANGELVQEVRVRTAAVRTVPPPRSLN
jgi:hypothetical protein